MNAVAQSGRPRLALIGVSGYGRIYVELVREALARDEITLAAAVVINPHEEAEIVREFRALGTRIYASYGEMLAREAGQIDLCLIPTGIQWHARMTVAALRAGAHVLVEKPLAGSREDAQLVRAAEAETGRWVAVGFQDIYGPPTRWMKERLCAGAIGRLRSVRLLGMWPRPRSYFSRNHWAGRFSADGGAVNDSPLNNAFAHFVNLGLYFVGPVVGEAAQATVESAELYRAHAIETFDTGVVRAVSPEGVRMWFGVTHCASRVREPEVLVEGEKGTAVWIHEDRCAIRRTGAADEEFVLPDTVQMRRHMFAAVLARVHDGVSPVCDTALSIRHTELISAVHRAGTIQPFRPDQIEWTSSAEPSAAVPVVAGLEAALEIAHRRDALLSECGLAATAAARRNGEARMRNDEPGIARIAGG